jgi:cobalamin synthase
MQDRGRPLQFGWFRLHPHARKGRLSTPELRRGRRGLLWFWLLGLAAAAGIFWMARTIPALADLLRPLYGIIALAVIFFTIRWFRPRTGDRRTGDRRHRRGSSGEV